MNMILCNGELVDVDQLEMLETLTHRDEGGVWDVELLSLRNEKFYLRDTRAETLVYMTPTSAIRWLERHRIEPLRSTVLALDIPLA